MSAHLSSPEVDPMGDEIERAIHGLTEALSRHRGNALLLAERTVSQLRATAALRQSELVDLIATKRANPIDSVPLHDADVTAACAAAAAARDAVAVARRDLAALRAEKAPGISASVAGPAAVLAALAEGLLGHLEQIGDALAEADDALARVGAPAPSRIAAGIVVLRLVRDARVALNGG